MRKLIEQIIKFGGVGVVCTAIEYVLLFVMESLLSVDLLWATAISFLISTVINYILSVKFVFQVNNGMDKKTNATVFVVMSLIGMGINQAIMQAGVWILGPAMDKLYMLVKILATGLVMVYNFITRKLFLERKIKTSEEADQ